MVLGLVLSFPRANTLLSTVPSLETDDPIDSPFEPVIHSSPLFQLIFPQMDKKTKLTELLQYGFEVKYLPLARYLQTAPKYISTATWCAAREEFRLARVFEKYLELRNGNTGKRN